jgi:hypothetical protein
MQYRRCAAEAKKGASVGSLDEVKDLLGPPVYEAYLNRAREVANRLGQVMNITIDDERLKPAPA